MEVCQSSMIEGTTEQHVLVPKRCCYCIPHRLVLFVLAVLKLVLSFSLLIVLTLTLYFLMIFSELVLFYPIFVMACIAIVIGLADMFIGLVAIVSICMKDQEMMELYYRYTVNVFRSLTVLCCVTFVLACYSYFSSRYMFGRIVIVMSIFFWILLSIMVVQLCLNLIVKREVRNLRSNEQFLL